MITKPASHDRPWHDAHARTTSVKWLGDTAYLSDVRDWSYKPSYVVTDRTWREGVAIDPSKVKAAWLVAEKINNAPASHIVIMLDVEGAGLLALSIGPRQINPARIVLPSAFLNGYELHYEWMTARDHLLKRTVFTRENPLRVYRVNRSPDALRRALRSLLEQTQHNHDAPSFYNALTNNCVTEILRAFDMPWKLGYMLKIEPDEYYVSIGFLEAADTFDALYAKALSAGAVSDLAELPADTFEEALRGRLYAEDADAAYRALATIGAPTP